MKETYKILIVHNFYQIPGGEDTVVKNETEMLQENGNCVYLYTRNNSEMREFSFWKKLLIPFTSIFSLKTYRNVKKIIKEKGIEIVHVHNTLTLISPSVYYAAFTSRVPVIQTLHNFRMLCPGGTFTCGETVCEECVQNGLWSAVRKKCYRDSRMQTFVGAAVLKVHRLLGTYRKVNYICLTEFNKNKLFLLNSNKKKIIDEKRVFIKPNFVKGKEEVIPFAERKNYFLFAGRLERIKGITVLLEAWKEIKDSELILCGTGPEEAWVRDYIKSNGISNVKLMGQQEHRKVVDLMKYARALILPSQSYEGLPMTVLESYSVGTPVLGSDLGNTGNIIEEGITGFHFNCRELKSIREAVKKCKKDMVQVCYREYLEKYQQKENYGILLDIYKRAIKQNVL